MEMQSNYMLSGVECLNKNIDTSEFVQNEASIDMNKAFSMFMLYQKSSDFFTEHARLSVDQSALKANFIDLLYKEGLISKEICYTAKRLMKEAGNNGGIE